MLVKVASYNITAGCCKAANLPFLLPDMIKEPVASYQGLESEADIAFWLHDGVQTKKACTSTADTPEHLQIHVYNAC